MVLIAGLSVLVWLSLTNGNFSWKGILVIILISFQVNMMGKEHGLGNI